MNLKRNLLNTACLWFWNCRMDQDACRSYLECCNVVICKRVPLKTLRLILPCNSCHYDTLGFCWEHSRFVLIIDRANCLGNMGLSVWNCRGSVSGRSVGAPQRCNFHVWTSLQPLPLPVPHLCGLLCHRLHVRLRLTLGPRLLNPKALKP